MCIRDSHRRAQEPHPALVPVHPPGRRLRGVAAVLGAHGGAEKRGKRELASDATRRPRRRRVPARAPQRRRREETLLVRRQTRGWARNGSHRLERGPRPGVKRRVEGRSPLQRRVAREGVPERRVAEVERAPLAEAQARRRVVRRPRPPEPPDVLERDAQRDAVAVVGDGAAVGARGEVDRAGDDVAGDPGLAVGRAPDVPLADAMTVVRCLLYTSPSPRDATLSRMPSSA